MKNKQTNKSLIGRTGKDLINLLESKEKRLSESDAVAPTGETEIALFDVWKKLLGHDNFGVQDDFFKSGGNSLKAIQLVSHISKIFSADIELTDIFLRPTIKAIAVTVDAQQQGQSCFCWYQSCTETCKYSLIF
jgi:acyl carrier protein